MSDSPKLSLRQTFEFMRKVDDQNLPLDAVGLLLHFMTHQGAEYIFHEAVVCKDKKICKTSYRKFKQLLIDKGFITQTVVYENGRVRGLKISVNYLNTDVNNTDVNPMDVLESKKNIEREKSKEREKSFRVGNCVPPVAPLPPTASDTQTTAQEFTLIPEPISEPKKRFITPTSADITQYISEKLAERGISWSPEEISYTADSIFNFYSSKNWYVGKNKMSDWKRAVSGWLGRDNWIPKCRQQFQNQQPVRKSFKQQDLDYANRMVTDPVGEQIRSTVQACLAMGGNDPCEYGLPVQYREQAMNLLAQERQKLSQSFTSPFQLIGG